MTSCDKLYCGILYSMGRFLLWASLFPLYRQEGFVAAKYPILWIALALGIAV